MDEGMNYRISHLIIIRNKKLIVVCRIFYATHHRFETEIMTAKASFHPQYLINVICFLELWKRRLLQSGLV